MKLHPVSPPAAFRHAPRAPRLRPAMPLAVAVVLGSFVLVAVLSVLAVGAWTGYRNTADLLREKAVLVVDAAVARLRLHLGAAEEQVGFVARALADGEVRVEDIDTFVALMGGAVAATPQINALYYLDADHRLRGTERYGDGVVPVFAGLGLDPDMRAIIAEAREHRRPYWADFLWRDTFQALHINLRAPVWRDGEFLGVVMALVSVPALSEMIGDLESAFGYNAFILIDESRVLAHPQLQFGFPGLSRWKPLPTIAEMGDPVLAEIWRGRIADPTGLRTLVTGRRGHGVSFAGTDYVFLYDEVAGFGPRPWLVGTYVRANALTSEVDRLWWAFLSGGLLIVGALVTAGWMGWAIARPARRMARAAHSLMGGEGGDGMTGTMRLKGSPFRELDEAVAGFNALAESHDRLRRHAPAAQIAALAASGRSDGQPWTERRPVTVLAIALNDLPALAQAAPEEAAARGGEFLAAVAMAVHATGGMVERHGIDSATAWWDSPTPAIATVTTLARRLAATHEPLARLHPVAGLDSGVALVGCVPAGDHLAFTILGGPALGAAAIRRHAATLTVRPGAALTAVASAATVRAAGVDAASLGLASPEDAAAPVELFRLI